MKPTRTELLSAWMTLVKVLEHYDSHEVDDCDEQMIRSILKLLDKLQSEEK